jgi:polygalacturonase
MNKPFWSLSSFLIDVGTVMKNHILIALFIAFTSFLSTAATVASTTAAFQKIIDETSQNGGGIVRVGAGTHVIGSLFLKSNVTLFLEEGAVLKGSSNKRDYNPLNVCPQNRASKAESATGAHLLLCIGQTNVAIRGRGKIDGNCDAFLLDPNGIPWPGGESRIPWRTSQMLYFVESSDLTVEGITLENSPYWSCFFHGCKNVAVRNLRVRTRRVPYHAHNGDGIDIDCCEDVEVSGCDINTADDCIAIRAYQSPLLSPRPCARIRVRDCKLSSACNAIRLGVGDGIIKDVHIRNIKVNDTRTAVDIVSSWRPGGRGVAFKNILIDTMDVDSVLLCRISPNFAKETRIDGVTFANVTGKVECSSWITGRPDSPIGKIVLDNVNLPHGVVCLNAPDVRIVGGEFSLIEPPFEEKQSMNRKIAEKNVFPCVFKGELYRSIQSRRKKFAR